MAAVQYMKSHITLHSLKSAVNKVIKNVNISDRIKRLWNKIRRPILWEMNFVILTRILNILDPFTAIQ